MLTTLEKAKALKEFRGLRVALVGGELKTIEKAKSLKRFRELRVLLGGGVKVNLDQKERTLPEQQAKLLANFPSITTFIDTAKMNGFDNAGVSWNGGYCMIPIGDGGIGNMVEVLFNVVGDDKGKLIVRRWNDTLSKYDDIASFGAYDGDTKNIQNAFVEAKKYVTDNTTKDFTPLLNSIINGDVSVFDDGTKLTELADAVKELGGDDMPDENKGLFIEAIKAAGVQVLEGQGFELVD